MADPFSIASGVAGVISLGLTLCNGLHTYLSTIKDRGEDVESACQLLALLRSNIDLIGSSTSTLNSRYARATQGVRLGLKLCESQLKALETVVLDLGDVNGLSSVASKWQKQKSTALYPFNRNKLAQVQDQLLKATGVLGTFVQNLILNVNISMGEDLEAFRNAVNQSSLVTHEFLTQIKEQAATTLNNDGHQHEVNCKVLTQLDVIASGIEEIRALSPSTHPQPIERASDPRRVSAAKDPTHNRDFMTPQCTCSYSRRGLSYRRRTCHSWGGVVISKADLQDKHQLGCALFTAYSSTKSTKTTITYTGLRSFLFKILDFSLEHNCRAGTYTISYSLRTCNVREYNPASDIIFLSFLDNDFFTDLLFDPVHEAKMVKEKLEILYSSRIASPFDVDRNGDNVAHGCVEVFVETCESWIGSKVQNEMLQALRILLSYLCNIGVRIHETDHINCTPFDIAMHSGDLRFIAYVYDTFEKYHPQFDPSRNFADSNAQPRLYPICEPESQAQWTDILSDRLDVAEGIGYEGLLLAILQKNERRVQAILDSDRFLDQLSVRDPYSRHVLHFCCGWAAGLKLLLRFEAARALLNVADAWNLVPLDYALMYSGTICKCSDSWTECQGCSCCDVLQVFFDMDCKITVDRNRPQTLRMCSMKARKLLLQNLRDRRERLLEIATMHLPKIDLPDPGISGGKVLDVDIKLLWNKLDEKGVKLTEGLGVLPRWDDPKGFFFFVHCPKVADMALNFGFQDTDVPDSRSITPILELGSHFGREDDTLTYADWLLQKGANIERSVNSAKISAAHWLAVICGRWLIEQRLWNKDPACLRPEHVRVLSVVCSSKARSHLPCHCMTDELSRPLYYLLHGSLDWHPGICNAKKDSTYSGIVRQVKSTVDFLDRAVSGLDQTYLAKSVMHLMTIKALDIRHAPYCHSYAHKWSEEELQDPERQEEWNEICEEEQPLIEKLGELDEEFEQEFRRQNVSTIDFLGDYWLPRMRQVRKQQKEPLTEDQKQSLREAGVVLGELEESISDYDGSEYADESEHEKEEDDKDDDEGRGGASKDR